MGTTSACAENTPFERLELRVIWNYLRVRGEYRRCLFKLPPQVELPPRARRIHETLDYFKVVLGTTSACAENTVRNYW